MAKYKLSRKPGQKIVILNEQANAIAMIELTHRHTDEKGVISSLRIACYDNGNVSVNNRARRDGEQFEVHGVVFTVEPDTSPVHTQLTLEKAPKHLQVVRHEHYLKAINEGVKACA